ncbi:AAEL000472-PA [Aedes aegypti]|uniref:AAEL000472-PA n=1 Tax=Aedes aegypti TaxID=7159 RepID=Q17PC3_AEDAE|nr:AAEL000472-PA [Aedes aegypti]
MVLHGLLTFASSLAIGVVAVVGICYTVNYLHGIMQEEEHRRRPPTGSYRSHKQWEGYSDDSVHCTICLSSIREGTPKMLPCGHLFHNNCINGWMQESKKCPNCRMPL